MDTLAQCIFLCLLVFLLHLFGQKALLGRGPIYLICSQSPMTLFVERWYIAAVIISGILNTFMIKSSYLVSQGQLPAWSPCRAATFVHGLKELSLLPASSQPPWPVALPAAKPICCIRIFPWICVFYH